MATLGPGQEHPGYDINHASNRTQDLCEQRVWFSEPRPLQHSDHQIYIYLFSFQENDHPNVEKCDLGINGKCQGLIQ